MQGNCFTMRAIAALILLLYVSPISTAQTFAVASLKPSPRSVGPDYNNRVTLSPSGLSARNVTLKRLIGEAYALQPHQIAGAPNWLATAEFDLDAKADAPSPRAQLDRMLQALLAARFHLAFHRETRELRVYELITAPNGPKFQPAKEADAPGAATLPEFANLLAVKLTIPVNADSDPSHPGIASGAPIPVIDRTGLPGLYQIPFDLRPEPGADMFALLQRFLPDRLGLRLVPAKAPVELLVIDHADRTPVEN